MATKLAVEDNARSANPREVVVARCRIDEEHPDNDRFAAECSAWFGHPIVEPRSEYGTSIYGVFEKRKYIAGVSGAPCTLHLKKQVREAFERSGDIQVFGYTAEEAGRADRMLDANAHVRLLTPLIERGLTHADCLAMVERAGIELPVLYRMGYQHNNCVGCVKGGAGYWNKVRVDFPVAFERMAVLEEKLGAQLIKLGTGRVSLRTLPPDAGRYADEPSVECGIFCEAAEKEYQ